MMRNRHHDRLLRRPGARLMAGLVAGSLAASACLAEAAPLPRARPAAQTEAPEQQPQSEIAQPSEAVEREARPDAPPPTEAAEAASPAMLTAEVSAQALPRPRPETVALDRIDFGSGAPYYGYTPDFTMKKALDLVSADAYSQALEVAGTIDDPLALKLVEWLVARAPNSATGAPELAATIASHEGWPEIDRLREKLEQSFLGSGPDAAAIVDFYARSEPATLRGRLDLATALSELGRADEAAALARRIWRDDKISSLQGAEILARFGIAITRDDHLYRLRRLTLERRRSDALAQAALLGGRYPSLVNATLAVLSRDRSATRLVEEAGTELMADPLYMFSRSLLLRRERQPLAAARLMLRAPEDAAKIGGLEAWWEERMDLSRMLIDEGEPELAYRMVTETPTEDGGDRAEQLFLAGWYALRFIEDPARAEPHFKALAAMASTARTRSRGLYWLGRTFEASGRGLSALATYNEAARYGWTYYGQLAREEVGLRTTGAERVPTPSAGDRLRFASRETVRAIELLVAGEHAERAYPFLRQLGETVETPGEATLATELAARIGQPRTGMILAALAERRGIDVGGLTTPFLGVPPQVPLPEIVDRALVYAVARQESAFNVGAASHVGARGLMQMMPSTARATARAANMPFSEQRLSTDPLYNATLGAHHLGELLERVDGSYILTFVGYNAGPGRASDWVKAYGDPRGDADAIDWVERIPFDETRHYVQKVMENLQIYRSRLGHPLSLSADLVRGAGGS